MNRKRKLKIAIIGTRGIPARYGGFETCVDEVSRRLVELGHDVWVYCRKGNYAYGERDYKGVQLVVLPTLKMKSLDTITHSGLSILHLMRSRWDVVHIYGVGNAIYLVLLKLLGLRTVISVDGLEWNRKKWGWFARFWFKFSEFVVRRFADRVVADSNVIKQYYRDTHGVDTEYIPYGAYIDALNGNEPLREPVLASRGYVLFVGRLIPEKGVHFLIEAFRDVVTDKKLVIVGDDPYHREYVESLKASGDGRVVFMGYVYGQRYTDLCKHAYVYVQPSELEGTSPALLAAMGYGCCALVNGIDENKETIGAAGLVYAKNDVKDLARKLQHLIDNPAVVDDYRQRALERVKSHYNWDTIAQNTEELYTGISGKETNR
jgi:glycosyltransferase involved in cell wall biosynthesis